MEIKYLQSLSEITGMGSMRMENNMHKVGVRKRLSVTVNWSVLKRLGGVERVKGERLTQRICESGVEGGTKVADLAWYNQRQLNRRPVWSYKELNIAKVETLYKEEWQKFVISGMSVWSMTSILLTRKSGKNLFRPSGKRRHEEFEQSLRGSQNWFCHELNGLKTNFWEERACVRECLWCVCACVHVCECQ